jgi:methenyltetrahydrofolate cyclohydrolase
MYINRPIKIYLKDLAGRRPAPGGGSAAALEASLGCALISMVLNYTILNKKYKNVKDRAKRDLSKIGNLLKKAEQLIDDDVTAYGELSMAIKKKTSTANSLQRLYKQACDVPYSLCKITNEALLLAKEIVGYGNRNLVTDTAIAALMLESAFFGAKFNAYINLKSINDEKYLETVHRTLSELEEKIPQLKEEILHLTEGVIS